MLMQIEKIEKWRTADGVEHSTREMAEQWIVNGVMVRLVSETMEVTSTKAQDFLNVLTSNREQVRSWLAACDAMERASCRTP